MAKNEFYNKVCVRFGFPTLALPCIVSLRFSGRHLLISFLFYASRTLYALQLETKWRPGELSACAGWRSGSCGRNARSGCDSCMTECPYFLFITEVIKMSVSLPTSDALLHFWFAFATYCGGKDQPHSIRRCIVRCLIHLLLTKIKLNSIKFSYSSIAYSRTRSAYAIMAFQLKMQTCGMSHFVRNLY